MTKDQATAQLVIKSLEGYYVHFELLDLFEDHHNISEQMIRLMYSMPLDTDTPYRFIIMDLNDSLEAIHKDLEVIHKNKYKVKELTPNDLIELD